MPLTGDSRRLPEWVPEAMESGRILPVVPEHMVYMRCWSTEAKAPLVAQRTAHVWARLPERVIHGIWLTVRQWRPASWGEALLIEYSDMWVDHKHCYGQVKRRCQMRLAPAVGDMSDAASHFVIAHEFAHIYQSSLGLTPFSNEVDDISGEPVAKFRDHEGKYWGDTEDYEHDADRLAKSWGFLRRELNRWKNHCHPHSAQYTLQAEGCVAVATLDKEEAFGVLLSMPRERLIQGLDPDTLTIIGGVTVDDGNADGSGILAAAPTQAD